MMEKEMFDAPIPSCKVERSIISRHLSQTQKENTKTNMQTTNNKKQENKKEFMQAL